MTLANLAFDSSSPASGSYGEIKFATDPSGRKVAVKFNNLNTDDSRRRFLQENELLHKFSSHDGVVNPLSDVFEEEHDYVIRQTYVMEKADTSMYLLSFENGYTDDNKLLNLITIAETLSHVHSASVLHRDLHFENILMFWNNASKWHCKICDFGRSIDHLNPLGLSENPAWGDIVLPPEYRFGEDIIPDNLKHRGDYYGLGLLVQWIFTLGIQYERRLRELPMSIADFLEKKGINRQNYHNEYTAKQRYDHYHEWCESYKESQGLGLYSVNFNGVKSDELTAICETLSDVNFENRISDLNPIIRRLKGI